MSAVGAVAVWGALVLLQIEAAPSEALASPTASNRVDDSSIVLPMPIPRQADPEPLGPTVDQRAAIGHAAPFSNRELQAIDADVAALEIDILLPDGRLADSALWRVSLSAETPPFVGGSNSRRILMLDMSRQGYAVS